MITKRQISMFARLASLLSLFLSGSHLAAQGANGAKAGNPPPKHGVLIETVPGKPQPEVKFTNNTGEQLGIIYGKEKFDLQPGKSTNVPVPQDAMFDLRIFEVLPAAGVDQVPRRERFRGKATPKDPEQRLIPLEWAEPLPVEAEE